MRVLFTSLDHEFYTGNRKEKVRLLSRVQTLDSKVQSDGHTTTSENDHRSKIFPDVYVHKSFEFNKCDL